jgi:hypothetical protein
VVTHVPGHPLVLDISRVAEYRWAPATPCVGETHRHRPMGVRAYREPLRRGEPDAVIAAWEDEANAPTYTVTQRPVVQRTLGSDRRHRPSMPDDADRARGWPIGTGVVEGACGHRVKDRREQSGMRWTTSGAPAGLDLRAVRLHGQWDVSGQCHRPQPPLRPYGPFAPAPERTEAQALKRVASSTLSTDLGHTRFN